MSGEQSRETLLTGALDTQRPVASAGRSLLVVAAGAALGLAAFAAGDPLVGAVGALAVLLAWVALAGPYAFAAGQVALAAAVTDPLATLPTLLLAEALLLTVLIVPTDTGDDWRLSAGTLAALVGLVAVAGLGLVVFDGSTPTAALVLLVTGGLLGYGVHRYETVRLGVVRDE